MNFKNAIKEGTESVRDDERCGRSKEVNTPQLIGQRVRVNKLRFQGSSGRDSVRRGKHSSNGVSSISTWTMHQSTTPSLSLTIWPRWASRQFLSLPIVGTLLSVTFSYSLSSEAVVVTERRRNCLDTHLGQIVSDKDGVVDWCIVLVEMPLTRLEECWPLPMESLPELP